MANNNIVSYQQKCLDFGLKTNSFLLSRTDTVEVERVVQEQVEILAEIHGFIIASTQI